MVLDGRTDVTSIDRQHAFYVGLLAPARGERVLDAGCGRGATIRRGIEAMPSSSWYGIDSSLQAVGGAREALGPAVRLTLGDLRWLPYAKGSFDAVLSRDTLECIPEPLEAIEEMVRVARPGGRLLLCHWDWYSQSFGVPDQELAHRLAVMFAETQQGWMETLDPAMGRKLRGLAAAATGIEVLATGILTLREREWSEGRFGHGQSRAMAELLRRRGRITQRETESWLEGLEAAQAGGTYSYSLDHYWVLARKRAN